MEGELEGMLVGSWVQGDRAKLVLRIDVLEKQLALVVEGRRLEREAFQTQREKLTNRLSEMEHEAVHLVREISLKAQGQEQLLKICQKKVQELEAETLLLGEQLRMADAKFRETEKALQRTRQFSRRHHPGDAAENSGQRCVTPVPISQTGGKENCLNDGDDKVLLEHFIVPILGPSHESSVGGTNKSCHDSGGKIATDMESRFCGDQGDLSRAVEKLVEGLLAENQRLESVVDKLQVREPRAPVSNMPKVPILSGAGEQPRSGLVKNAGEEWRDNDKLGGVAPATSATNSAGVSEDSLDLASRARRYREEGVRGRKEMAKKEPCGESSRPRGQLSSQLSSDDIQQLLTATSRPGDAKENNTDMFPSNPNVAVLEERGQNHCPRDMSEHERPCSFPAGSPIAEGEKDISTALTKIQALRGMVRAQEEIEALLDEEIRELNKKAKDRERLWRLILRWKDELEARGYAAENDIRAAGLLENLRKRLHASSIASCR